MTGEKLPALLHLETEDNYVSLTKHIFVIQSCHACISRFSESVEMHLKKSLQGKPSERNFLNQGQCVALSYQTRFAYQQNDEVF